MDGYEEYATLGFDRPDDGVLRITLSNPGKLNAVDRPRHAALADVWRQVDRDDATRVVVLEGEGGAFSAGGDLEMARRMHDDEAWRNGVFREARDLVYNMVNCSKLVVSAIEGPAVGAGAAAALLADVSIAGRSARIIDGHTKLGVVAGDHAAIIWPLLCGMAKAKYHLLTCDTLTGEEAERIGLVSRVVDDGTAGEEALALAGRFADGPQQALRWTKLALNGWLRDAGAIFDASAALEMLSFTSPDVLEGIDAIREKRPPRFPSASG